MVYFAIHVLRIWHWHYVRVYNYSVSSFYSARGFRCESRVPRDPFGDRDDVTHEYLFNQDV